VLEEATGEGRDWLAPFEAPADTNVRHPPGVAGLTQMTSGDLVPHFEVAPIGDGAIFGRLVASCAANLYVVQEQQMILPEDVSCSGAVPSRCLVGLVWSDSEIDIGSAVRRIHEPEAELYALIKVGVCPYLDREALLAEHCSTERVLVARLNDGDDADDDRHSSAHSVIRPHGTCLGARIPILVRVCSECGARNERHRDCDDQCDGSYALHL